ncbi:MAG: beta strand repeat-containing protein, partial [Bacteroidota bacterium]
GLSTQAITWTNLPSASGQYTLQYSLNNGTNWTTIVSNITGNSYNWSVPNSPSTSCLIKVIDFVNTCKFDVSNAVFTISPATPIVITPNGGESYYAGTVNAITWNAATYFSSVRLDYSIDNGVTWVNITTSTTNDGSQNWTVPNVSSTNCLVRVSNTADLNVFDVSNAVFTIKPAVTIITPNGDNGVTIWGGCTVTSITFDRSPAWSNYVIEYSINNGSTWTTITNSWSTSSNPATYNWSIPNTPTTQALVRVTPSSTSFSDASDNVFTITKPVTIIQPNFGGIMQIGTNYNIMWQSDGISNLYDIFYSTNGGASFTNIVTGYNTSNNTYSWLVPATASNNCRILVRDNINSCKADTSDIAFIISPTAPAITLTSPNGIADTLYGCQTKTITWTETTAIGTYNLAYSLNGGNTWINIVTNYSTATGTYNWIVPNTINSSAVLLRVQSAGNPSTVFDLSNAYFTILNGNLVATPAFTSVCSSVPVQLNATGGSNYSWSPASGLNNPNIANPIATPSSTTTYIVQSNNSGCVLSDTVVVQITTGGTTASVNITSSPTGTICAGTPVTFTANGQNTGTSPTYTWKLNGITVGSNSTSYTSSTLNNNDVVTCIMVSNLPCVAGSPATSNAITMSVSPLLTPSVSVQTNPGTTICQGTNVSFTAIPVNGGSSPAYQWKLNGANVGSGGNTYSNAGLNNSDVITVVLTSNATCLSQSTGNSSDVVMTVNPIPSTAGNIIGSTTQCVGTSVTYSVANIAGASSYQWTLPSGWSGNSTTNSITTVVGANGGNISVSGVNSCGTGGAQSINVSVNTAPAVPISISGNLNVCAATQQTYSVAPVSGASSYTWTLPLGWTGSSTSNTIDVNTGTTSGNITVTANNSCGNSAPQSIAVNVGSVPPISSPIAGASSVCAGTSQTYSINPVAGATSYNWTLPGGWTGSSTTNSITTTAGSSGGNISVTASFACGVSLPQTLAVSVLSVPVLSGTISGSTNVCSGAQATFSITSVNGATNYNWTAPAGWAITNNNNSAVMTAGSASGNVTINVDNACGVSNTLQLAVTVSSTPAQPGAISGSQSVCSGSTNTYSIATVSGASSYNWNLPTGWTGTSTSNTINAIAGTTSGNITVTANNSCGNSAPQIINISSSSIPAVPSIISGLPVVCENATEVYSVIADPSVSDYIWSIPASWLGSSSSNSINLTVGNSGGQLAVSASNSCGTSSSQVLTIQVTNLPASPNSIIGSSELCAGSTSYSIPLVTGATSYEWILPSGWSGSSVTNNINVNASAGTGSIVVSALNTCGSSTPQSLNVTIHALPNVALDLSPINIQCVTASSVQLIGGTPLGGSYAGNTVGAGIFNPSLAGVGNHVIQYSFVDSNSCSAFAYDTIMVDVCIGVEDIANTSVKAYPNPGNGLLNIVIDGKVNTMTCEVYNAAGMMVKSIALTDKNNLIDLSEFANGFYLLKIQDQDKVETIHYIKQ